MDPVIHVLVNMEELLEEVFSYLPAVDLLRISSVCQSWERTAKRILHKRSRLLALDFCSFTFNGLCCEHAERQCGEHSAPTTSIRRSKRIKLQSKIECQLCVVKRSAIAMRNLWLQTPKVVVIVCKSVDPSGEAFSKNSKAFYNVLKECLPKHCVILMIRSAMCCRMMNLNFVLKTEALLFFSARSNCLKILTWTSLKTTKSRNALLKSMKESFFCQKDLKMLLLFYDISDSNLEKWIRTKLVPSLRKDLGSGGNVVILGSAIHDHAGIVHSKCCSNSVINLVGSELQGKNISLINSEDGGRFLALAFGGSSIFSASMLANSFVTTVSELSAKLKHLNKSCESKTFTHQNSFGMIVSCIDRMHDSVWYDDFQDGDNHVEINALQKEFPKLPILTVHSFGEIGGDCNLLGVNNEDSLRTQTGASIFAVVQIGD